LLIRHTLISLLFPYTTLFRSSFSSWQIGNSMGEWAYENIGDKIYVAAADYAFGREASAAFIEAYTGAGGEVVGEVYPPLENNDYASYLRSEERRVGKECRSRCWQ